MNRVDDNINKDMIDSELIDVESLDFSDEQTWLYELPEDSGQKVDILDWNLSCDWPTIDDNEYPMLEKQLYTLLDEILKDEAVSLPDKHKFDSRTYVRPKKRYQRPSIQNIVEVTSNPSSISPFPTMGAPNKYLTYNKYSMPLGPVSPMLRLKTFNVDTNTDNSVAVKEYAMKRRSLVQEDDPQLEDNDVTLVSNTSCRSSIEPSPSKPINIDFSQPAHNLHNTFNKGLTNIINERGSLNMYQSGESLMRMSPPSLVSSMVMETSGSFNPESMESRKSAPSHRDSGIPNSVRDSIDPMMTSMTLSILDEKDMSTSFLSQTTYPDNDSLIDSLPPSLVSSVNSSYIVSNSTKARAGSTDSNIFSSATFTHLEQSEKLLSARPRCQLYNSFTKRESSIRNSESYTKAREEACQNDSLKVLNENNDKKDIVKPKPNGTDMTETITLHYANNKFRRDNDPEKENFDTDDAFYNDMGLPVPDEQARNSLNVTMGKQELNEIIQARQKLSLARKALPSEPDKPLPNQIEKSPIKVQTPNQTVPKQSTENASELLSRRLMNGLDKDESNDKPMRETPKRNATFYKKSTKTNPMDMTIVYTKDDNQMIDINAATLNLIDSSEKTQQQVEWGLQERAMVGSSESTDTGTFSSSSPPESVPDNLPISDLRFAIASTPVCQQLKKCSKTEMLRLHDDLSPIYGTLNDKSYTLTKAPSTNESMDKTYDMHNTTVINSATLVKKSPKRDVMAGRVSSDKRMQVTSPQKSPTRRSPTDTASYGSMVPPAGLPRKTNLPTSKLRQYSSHRELSRIPAGNPVVGPRGASGRTMLRRGVYASNPALSPTTSVAPAGLHMPVQPVQTDSYTIAVDQQRLDDRNRSRPVVHVPPPLIRQGTETLRRERPQSQLVAPRDVRGASGSSGVPVSYRNHQIPPPSTRPYSVAGAQQFRVSRPSSTLSQAKPVPAVPVVEQPRATSAIEPRVSALPRPSRLPAPRRTLRPPSVYSMAPTATDIDHY